LQRAEPLKFIRIKFGMGVAKQNQSMDIR